jgi:transcriptional regulator with XRE-family HTH domain
MIGERLLKLRKERKMYQDELAMMLSLSKFSISLYEHNKSVPSEETLCKLAEIFDISLDYLLGLVDEPYSYHRDAGKIIRIPQNIPQCATDVLEDFVAYLSEKYS